MHKLLTQVFNVTNLPILQIVPPENMIIAVFINEPDPLEAGGGLGGPNNHQNNGFTSPKMTSYSTFLLGSPPNNRFLPTGLEPYGISMVAGLTVV